MKALFVAIGSVMPGLATVFPAIIILAGTATAQAAAPAQRPTRLLAPPPPEARAEINDPAGRTLARARISEDSRGLRVRVTALGLPAGIYGAHVHAVGRCDGTAFAGAGGHWNPAGHQHGRLNPLGQHMGDLPNLTIGADGRGTMDVMIPGATLRSGDHPLLDGDGASMVIHANADDYRADPSGNSGGRIACGVLR